MVDSAKLEIKQNHTRARLGWWAVQEVQKRVCPAVSTRLHLNPDDPRLVHTAKNNYVFVTDYDGQEELISVFIDLEAGQAEVVVDSLHTLFRPGRQADFNPEDVGLTWKDTAFNVNIAEALELIPTWDELPRNYSKAIPEHSRPFSVEGGINEGGHFT